MFGPGGLFMKYNAYVPEGRNEGGRVATPTRFSIFDSYKALDSYDMKCLWFEFGHNIWIQNGKSLKVGMPVFQLFYEM